MDDQEKIEAAAVLDLRDLLCPLPVLKARKRLMQMAEGEVLRLEATDPMAMIDIPHFCHEQGHELLMQGSEDGVYRFAIRRGADRPEE